MRRAARLKMLCIRQSVEQSKTSLTAAIDANRLDQRAWIGIVGHSGPIIKSGERIKFTTAILNTGKTPAIEVTGHVGSFSFAAAERFRPVYTDSLSSNRQGPSVSIMMPNQQQTIETNGHVPMNQLEIDRLKAGAEILYFFGEMCYKDVFKRQHYVSWCQFLMQDLTSVRNCRVYNTTDDEKHDYCKE
jgi:hypothetical protein